MPKRVDQNQRDIVEALRKMGATVQIISMVGHGCPDILVGFAGKNYLFELKSKGGNLTKCEWQWHCKWHGKVAMVRSFDEAYEILTEDVNAE